MVKFRTKQGTEFYFNENGRGMIQIITSEGCVFIQDRELVEAINELQKLSSKDTVEDAYRNRK